MRRTIALRDVTEVRGTGFCRFVSRATVYTQRRE